MTDEIDLLVEAILTDNVEEVKKILKKIASQNQL